jgi:hypothetical protein
MSVNRWLAFAGLAVAAACGAEPDVRGEAGDPPVIPNQGPEPMAYQGPCAPISERITRGQLSTFTHDRRFNPPTVNYGLFTLEGFAGGDTEFATLEVYAANADLGSLGGRRVSLGPPNDNLGTCTHCIVIGAGCDENFVGCTALLLPFSGQVVAQEVALADGESFAFLAENIEFRPVRVVDGTTLRTEDAGPRDNCVFMPQLVVTGRATLANDCDIGIQCPIEDTLGARVLP